MKPTIYDVELTFTEPLLGATPMNPEIYSDFIQQKWREINGIKDDSEIADELDTLTLDETMEKGMTGFHRLDDGTPCLYNYVIKGFFKDACSMLRRNGDCMSSKLTAYRKVIDGLVFAEPRRIAIELNGDMGVNTRPLRAQTAQGERVALACSEEVPIGSKISFRLLVLGKVTENQLIEWFEYGALRGLGQWRNGGWGSFTYELSKRE